MLKLAGTVFALALVQPWGRRMFPRRLLLVVGWGCSALLIVYGGGQLIYMALIPARLTAVPEQMNRRGFYGHLLIREPWFLIWSLLLAPATTSLARSSGLARPTSHPALPVLPGRQPPGRASSAPPRIRLLPGTEEHEPDLRESPPGSARAADDDGHNRVCL